MLFDRFEGKYRIVWLIEEFIHQTDGTAMNIHMDEILPGLFLGSEDAVHSRDASWTHVLTILKSPIIVFGIKQHNQIFIEDEDNEPIEEHFSSAADWIHHARRTPNSKVLVHCHAGISRSPTILSAYLIKYYQVTADEALELINRHRTVLPNTGFLKKLYSFRPLIPEYPKAVSKVDFFRTSNF